jgi:hypothetical protein
VVELSALQRQEHGRERLQPQQVVEDEGRRRVVRAVVERGDLGANVTILEKSFFCKTIWRFYTKNAAVDAYET